MFENFHIFAFSRREILPSFYSAFYLGSYNNVACNLQDLQLAKSFLRERRVHNRSFQLKFAGQNSRKKRKESPVSVFVRVKGNSDRSEFMQTMFIVYGKRKAKRRQRIERSLAGPPPYHLELYLASLGLFSFFNVVCGCLRFFSTPLIR